MGTEMHKTHCAIDLVFQVSTDEIFMEVLEDQGIMPEQWEVAIGSKVWMQRDHRPVRQCLDALLFGLHDVAGIARIEIPAEEIAAFGIIYVQPANWYTFCRIYENANSMDSILTDDDTKEPASFEQSMSAKRLHAMMIQGMSGYGGHDLRKARVKLQKALYQNAKETGKAQ